MSALIGKFRSARYRQLAELAVAQKFQPEERGSGHFGLVCPECGTCIILSTTQRDNADYKYLNQVAYLRRHGLKMPGKKSRGCLNVKTQRDTLESLKKDGVYVVLRERYHGHSEVVAVVTSLTSASAAVIDDSDFWANGAPVTVGERDIWINRHRWDDPYTHNWESDRFTREKGRMTFIWFNDHGMEEGTEYYVQWRDIALKLA